MVVQKYIYVPQHYTSCQSIGIDTKVYQVGRVTIFVTTLVVAPLTGKGPKTPDTSSIRGLDHHIAKIDPGDIP